MTTYKVYSIRKNRCSFTIATTRKGLTLAEARAFREERMSNPNRQVSYTVVAETREEEFFSKIAAMEEQYFGALKRQKEQRWKKMDEMYRQGYKVKDALEYLYK